MLAVLILGPVRHGLHAWSKNLTQQARGEANPENRRHYQLAVVLDPHNQAAIDGLADIYAKSSEWGRAIWILKLEPLKNSGLRVSQYKFELGDYAAAAKTADQTAEKGSDGADLEVAKSRALLEENQITQALTAAQKAYELNAGSITRLQLAICQSITGKFDQIVQLESQASHAELGNLQRAGAGDVALAQVLYEHKLYHAAASVLRKSTIVSTERYYLLALLDLKTGNPNYTQAHNDLVLARSVDPSSIKVHQLLLQVDNQLKLTTEAAQEQKYLDQLHNGQI